MTDEQILKNHTARRLAADRKFLGWHLARYCEIERLSQDELCFQLQLSGADLPLLGLCIAPDLGVPDFADRIKNIAEYTGANATQLAQIIRLVAIHNQHLSANSAKIIPMVPSSADGMLMAAREKNSTNPESNSE